MKGSTMKSPLTLKEFSKSRTERHHRNECNINVIMRRAQKTGLVPMRDVTTAMQGDFTEAEDFMQTQNKIARVKSEFERLPSNIRKYFRNDPAQLLAFVSKPENREKAVELGLIKRSVQTEPVAPVEPAEKPQTEPAGPPE